MTHASILGGELWFLGLGMGTTIGEKSRFGQNRTQFKSCKQCDIFLFGLQFCRSDYKSSDWMGISDSDGGQIGGRLEDRRVIKSTQTTHTL
jgi:hypothetical protein